MGLAASQARLLTITARKADCEFQSMTLSHEKIALSRDMEKISDEYQNATNQTKLVYDYYGTGTSQMNLNYGLLMSPSVYNDYYPKLITDNKNRVVLSDKYADAAKKAGIPAERVKKLYEGRPNILDLITNGKIQLIVNSPVGKDSIHDDSYLRKNAIKARVPYITTIDAARAAAEGIRYVKKHKIGKMEQAA